MDSQPPPGEQTFSENQLEVLRQAASILGISINELAAASKEFATNPAAPGPSEQQNITSVVGGKHDSILPPYDSHDPDLGIPFVGTSLPIPSFLLQHRSNLPPLNPGVHPEEAYTVNHTTTEEEFHTSAPKEDYTSISWTSHDSDTALDSTSDSVWNTSLISSRPLLLHQSSSDDSDNNGWIEITPPWSGESTEIDALTESSENSDTGDTAIMSLAGSPYVQQQPNVISKLPEASPLRNSISLQYLAPKPDGRSTGCIRQPDTECVASVPSPGTALSRVKTKRKPFKDDRIRKETSLTRQLNACLRCRMQRNRCKLDLTNPKGPCISCQGIMTRITRLPCLRYKITDSVLFRTGLDYMPFYKKHPMIGPTYGDFHIAKDWMGATTRFLDVTQDRSPIVLRLEVREFHPPYEENSLDLKGRSMYCIPWAIVDPDVAVETINAYIDQSVGSYLDAMLDDTDSLVWDVFHIAFRLSVFPMPNKLLRNVLRLWVVCRFIESRWRCCGDDTLNAESLKNPFYDWISPPPYIDYQLASVIIERILGPLRHDTLHGLQGLVLSNKPSNWYPIFLTSFILLHNYELQVLFQRQFASRRQAQVRYLDMPLVRATHSGAKTILAHFHYCCKGQQPFHPDFDWATPQIRKMAQLDSEQIMFMEKIKERVNQKVSLFQAISLTDQYEDTYWFTSQLFDTDWSPRDTYEHSPAV